MVMFIKVNGNKIKHKDMVFIFMLMVKNFLGFGKMINSMEKDNKFGKMDLFILDNIFKE